MNTIQEIQFGHAVILVFFFFIAIVAAFYLLYSFVYIFIMLQPEGEEEPSELHSRVRYEQTAKLMKEINDNKDEN